MAAALRWPACAPASGSASYARAAVWAPGRDRPPRLCPALEQALAAFEAAWSRWGQGQVIPPQRFLGQYLPLLTGQVAGFLRGHQGTAAPVPESYAHAFIKAGSVGAGCGWRRQLRCTQHASACLRCHRRSASPPAALA